MSSFQPHDQPGKRSPNVNEAHEPLSVANKNELWMDFCSLDRTPVYLLGFTMLYCLPANGPDLNIYFCELFFFSCLPFLNLCFFLLTWRFVHIWFVDCLPLAFFQFLYLAYPYCPVSIINNSILSFPDKRQLECQRP